MRRTRRRAAATEERAYLSLVASLGCLACLKDGVVDTPAEIHHSRLRPDGTAYGTGIRASHREVVPLCPPHHRGGVPGVLSRHLDEAAFIARYGDDLRLQSDVARLLAGQPITLSEAS